MKYNNRVTVFMRNDSDLFKNCRNTYFPSDEHEHKCLYTNKSVSEIARERHIT